MSPLTSIFVSIWPQLGFGLLISAIVLSYGIERRSPDLKNQTGLPRSAMLFHTVTNRHVARDATTQAMRRTMLLLLAGIPIVFALAALAIRTIVRPA